MEHPAVELLALALEQGQRGAVRGHEKPPGDVHVDLAQRTRVGRVVPVGAVVDEEHVVVVVVELGPLAEFVGVLERERMKAEDAPQLLQVVSVRRGQVKPEELVGGEMGADSFLVDLGQARHHVSVDLRGVRVYRFAYWHFVSLSA